MVDEDMMKLAKENAIFLHCLPAYRDYEVSEAVLEGSQSRILKRLKIDFMHKKRYYGLA